MFTALCNSKLKESIKHRSIVWRRCEFKSDLVHLSSYNKFTPDLLSVFMMVFVYLNCSRDKTLKEMYNSFANHRISAIPSIK